MKVYNIVLVLVWLYVLLVSVFWIIIYIKVRE